MLALQGYTLGTQGTIRKHREHTRNILRIGNRERDTVGNTLGTGNQVNNREHIGSTQLGTHRELGTE